MSQVEISEQENILKEIKEEINHHDIFSFKLGNQSLNSILSKTKQFEKKFFHYQRYNFKLNNLNTDLCLFDDIILEDKNKNTAIYDNSKNDNLIDEEGKRKKINDILSDKNVKISEVLQDIMEDVNIFDKIYQEEQNKIENEGINIDVNEDIPKNELKYFFVQQAKENEKLKLNKPIEFKQKEKVYPIEIIDKIEKDYNNILIEKIKKETKDIDLYPLDTYKQNNVVKFQLLSENEKNLQFQSLKERILIKEKSNMKEEKDIFCTFTVDKPNQEPGSIEPRFIYVGTNMGKIIKILLNNRQSQSTSESIREVFDSKEDGINFIDIFENYMVTAHQNGSILFWEDNKIFDKAFNKNENQKNIEVIYLKILKIRPKKKFEIIYSDKIGKVIYLKKEKGFFSNSETKELLVSDNGFPTYKICFFSAQNDLKKSKKKLMIFALTSPKGVSLIKIRPCVEKKDENKKEYALKFLNSPTGKIDNGIFDCSFGFGFPPIQEKISQKSSIRGSISDSIVIGKNEFENLLLAVSFAEIINIYEVKISRSNKLYINPIAHFVNDKPIIYISFLTNSYMSIISYDFFLKVINTFDFDKHQYKKKHDPTKNSLLLYESIELKKLIMMRQTNIFKLNQSDNKFSSYYIYLNTILTLNKSIIILGRQYLYQYTLLPWDTIIQSLDRQKEYEKMLWLAMVVYNNNKNLLTIRSNIKNMDALNKNNYQVCSSIISKFLIQVVINEIEKNNNLNPIRMLIEFCLGAELYDFLYEAVLPLSQKGYDGYLYENLTKYILNDDCVNIDFKPTFLFYYIKYYVEMHEKTILSESLFHIKIFNLIEHTLIKSAIEQYKLINPAIYIQIKNMEKGEIDYFKPIKYLYDIFHIDFCKEKENKLFETESDKSIKEEYYKLINEKNISYYNEDISTYYEFLGHKILWYCNKCLNGEEFHTDIKISKNSFEKVAKKIIIFLTLKEVIQDFLEFDSFSYFQVINRIFLENKLFNLIHREIESNKDLFEDIKDFVGLYLGKKKIQSYYLSDKYFFYEIQEISESFENIYIKYDYYKMISLICKTNLKFHLDKATLKNAIQFFIKYSHQFKNSSFSDKFNCHQKPVNLDEYKNQMKEIESDILTMIHSFENHNELFREDIDEILNIIDNEYFRKIKLYLYESSNQYEKCFLIYKEELEEDNPNIPKNEKTKLFFEWINNILSFTSLFGDNKEKENIHLNFKDFILSNLNYLSTISLSELSKLIENWFKGQEETIISKLSDSKSESLQFKYINYYLATHEYNPEQNDENNPYYKYLVMKIDLLVKANHKEQVLNILHHNNFLCKNEKLLNNLLSQEVYDACIFIYHILDKLKEGIQLVKNEIKKTMEEILEEINSNYYNSIKIDNELIKYKKYVDLGLGICQKSEKIKKKEIDLVNDYWILLIDIIYTFQIYFKPECSKNRNNYKTADYIKIYNALDESFESVLAKMTDCISLPLIFKVLGDKCGELGISKFKKLNYLMFLNYRLSEKIFNLQKNLIESGVSLEIDDYLYERNKGHFASIITCSICNEFIGDQHLDEIKYFSCNHVFHLICYLKNGEDDECPICKKNDCIINQKESNYFKIIDEIKYNQNIEKMRKKEEELNKKKKRKEKMVQLKKINKKRKEINNLFYNDLYT